MSRDTVWDGLRSHVACRVSCVGKCAGFGLQPCSWGLPKAWARMSEILTSREIADAVRDIRPHVEQLTETYKDAALRHVAAERAFKLKEAEVFLEAKGNGATDEMAKRIALIEAKEEKAALDALTVVKQSARLGSDAWQAVLDVYSALSHVLNRELKWHQQAS